jgi:hypothetical protein
MLHFMREAVLNKIYLFMRKNGGQYKKVVKQLTTEKMSIKEMNALLLKVDR